MFTLLLFFFIQYAIRGVYTGTSSLLPTVYRQYVSGTLLQLPPLCRLYERLNLLFFFLYFISSYVIKYKIRETCYRLAGLNWQECNNIVVPAICLWSLRGLIMFAPLQCQHTANPFYSSYLYRKKSNFKKVFSISQPIHTMSSLELDDSYRNCVKWLRHYTIKFKSVDNQDVKIK